MSSAEFISYALDRNGIVATKLQLDQLFRYVNLILEWGSIYNITSVKLFDEIITKHIVDSLSVLPYLPASSFSLLDVGSGAGLPGIPLSIMRTDISSCLLDSQEKKCSFMLQAKAELGLVNVDVKRARLGDFESNIGYDLIISRAFSSLAGFVCGSRHLCSKGGCWYAMKGSYPESEIEALPDDFFVQFCWFIKIRDSDFSRCLLKVVHRGRSDE